MAESSRIHIEAVIFDYGEVLSERADPVHMANMARISGLSEPVVRELYWRLRDEYDRGTYNGSSYWKTIGQATGRHFSDQQIAALIHEDVTSWSRVRRPMLEWLKRLQEAGVKTAVLSNMISDLLAHMRRDFDWIDTLTCSAWSCEVGAVKPEAAIYRRVLEGLDVRAERALFLDDREVNIAGARAVGIHGVVFRSIEGLREELAMQYDVPLP